MARCVKLRDNPYPSNHSISDYIFYLVCCVDLFWAKCSILGNFGMGVQFERERILIHNVPMHNAHLVVHQGINGLVDQVNGLIMSGCVDHKTTIRISWLVFDFYWKESHHTFCLLFVAGYSLHEGFKTSDKTHICVRFNICLNIIDTYRVSFLLSGEYTLELNILYLNFYCIVEPYRLKIQELSTYNIGNMASKSFELLMLNKLNKMPMLSLRLTILDNIQYAARILQKEGCLIGHVTFNILRHREK